MFFVYILHSEEFDTYYIGQTSDVKERLKRHNNGEVNSTKPYTPWKPVLSIDKPTRSEAMALEKKIKKTPVAQYTLGSPSTRTCISFTLSTSEVLKGGLRAPSQ